MTATTKANTRQTTTILKKHFKENFGIDVRIKSESYSGGSSIDLTYILGPDSEHIEAIVNGLQQGHFNGMEDIYEYDSTRAAVIIDGFELEKSKHV